MVGACVQTVSQNVTPDEDSDINDNIFELQCILVEWCLLCSGCFTNKDWKYEQ